MPFFNDFNLDNWKESEIWTDSLWIIPERDKTGKHNGFYHGNFIPQIPRQLILRYTKSNDIVFDPFVGSGTTLLVSRNLGLNSVGTDISYKYIDREARRRLNMPIKTEKEEKTAKMALFSEEALDD